MRSFRFTIVLNALALGALLFAGLTATVRAAQVPGVSGLNVATSTISDRTPVAIVGYNWHRSNQGSPGTNYIQCLNMRILSRKAVTAVRFTMNFEDQFGTNHFTWNLDRQGFFKSGAVWKGNYDSSHTYSNDKRELCFVVPTDRFDTGLSNITKLVIATTSVVFADGTTWHTGDSFDQAYLHNGAAFNGTSAASTPAPEPLNVTQNWVDLGHSPIERLRSSTGYHFGGNRPRQCVSFRNISDKTATDVTFSFTYEDAFNTPLVTQQHDFSGTFTPPVGIDDKCVYVNLGSREVMRRIARVDIHALTVLFQDGTQWSSGQGFTRAYGNDGNRLAQNVAVASYTPLAPAAPGNPATGGYQTYVAGGQPYVPAQSQTYVPQPTYAAQPQYQPTSTVQRPLALIGLQVSYANAVDRIVPIYAGIGPGFTLEQSVLGQSVGGSGGTETAFAPPGYVLTGIDVYRGTYGGVDEVLGMKLYWNRLTSNGIDANDGLASNVMRSSYPQTLPTKQLRADPGTYISNIMITPSTHSDGRTFVHDISIALTRF
ncbi:MAG TPA: hypothetical protein VNG31_01110 [Candidatus Baltobacteraceae bacterium]|nr:hypothetical protein [Candidatus Baltobacteraceae bacterium]